MLVNLDLKDWSEAKQASTHAYMHVKLLQCVLLFVTLWTIALQAPLSMAFCRQEYWSELPWMTLVLVPG